MEGILSQDEVDALMGGFDDSPEQAPAADPANGVRSYDLAKQERIVRGRMPTLEIINERFARNFRIGMFNFMRRSPELSVSPARVLKYSAFLRELILPTNLNIVQLKPLRGSALFVFEPTMVFAVVDTMFGGTGKVHTRIEGREFTTTEMRIIQRMLEMTLAEYKIAWGSVHPLEPEYIRSEMQPQFANVVTPSEVVVTSKFDIDLGGAGGALHICIPYASIEPIRDLLHSSTQADANDGDERWVHLLSQQVQTADVQMVATLTTIEATLQQLLNMRPGDVINASMPDLIQLAVDGVPVFEGRPGTVKGRYAVQIERALAGAQEEFGAQHGRQ